MQQVENYYTNGSMEIHTVWCSNFIGIAQVYLSLCSNNYVYIIRATTQG